MSGHISSSGVARSPKNLLPSASGTSFGDDPEEDDIEFDFPVPSKHHGDPEPASWAARSWALFKNTLGYV